jgi:hypothetical protein
MSIFIELENNVDNLILSPCCPVNKIKWFFIRGRIAKHKLYVCI